MTDSDSPKAWPNPKDVDPDKRIIGEELPDDYFKPMPVKARMKYFLIRSIVAGIGKVAAVAPENWTYGLCVRLTLMLHRRVHKFRKLARKHLEIAFGDEKSPEEIDEILRQTYINYGKNLAEFLMVPHKSKEWIESRVTFNDPYWTIRTELQKGNGVIGLSGHFGSWELVAARLGIYHYPIVVIVKAQRDALMSRFVMDTRTKWGNEYIFRTQGVKEECYNQLKQNKILALMADQNASRGGVFVDFFGREASTFKGPAFFGMTTKAPVVPCFPVRNEDNTIMLQVLDPVKLRDTGDFEEDLRYNVQQCALAVENFARKYPSEYFWWHRRWKTQRAPAEEREEANEAPQNKHPLPK